VQCDGKHVVVGKVVNGLDVVRNCVVVVLQCDAVCRIVSQLCCSVLQCVAVCCSVLQCVAVVLQYVAV